MLVAGGGEEVGVMMESELPTAIPAQCCEGHPVGCIISCILVADDKLGSSFA